ncbi:MAG: PorP/SprF family type IX secretion system membrane protein [Bacteroidales bacterium]|nr:PorP/SprF family type IX secretion system membrane protein [Bacteroidales bacterium]MCF8457794.1 PorP/SprF family type IX secretion system membrane protein [Bacteroidales bacterium]
MKKILTISAIIFLFLIVKSGMAQQEPLFSLYHQQLFLINPAATGNQDYLQAFVDARKQWSGFEMAPRTGSFGIHDSYNDKMGLGVLITGDKAGMIERLSGSLNYSYKIHFSREKKHNLTFGMGVGFIENKINSSEGRTQDFDPLLYNDNDGFAFDARFGILYNFRGFELGVAIPQVIDNDISYQGNNQKDYAFELKRHYLIHSGYRISIKKEAEEKFFLKPSVLYKMAPTGPEQLDINLIAGTSKNHWLGFTYRPTNKSMVVSGGIQVNNLGIAYAYQIANTLPTEYSNGTHELMLTYKFSSQAKEDRKLDEKIKEMNDRQLLMKSQVDKINSDVEGLNNRPAGSNNNDIKALEEKLQAEIDSLRNQLDNFKSDDGTKTIIPKNSTDQGELDRLNKELQELKQNVLEIKGEKVYELNKIQGTGKNVSFDKKSVEDGCYVIVYSFRHLENARRGVGIANSKGYTANILYNETRKWYYIYTAKYDELQPALLDMRKVREGEYDDAWVHIYKK